MNYEKRTKRVMNQQTGYLINPQTQTQHQDLSPTRQLSPGMLVIPSA